MRYISNTYDFSVTSLVKTLIGINVVAWFVFVVILQGYFFEGAEVFRYLGFVPQAVMSKYFGWQFVTYMFIHSPGIFHILFNMFVLWMFGSELERLWGSRLFLVYYLFCGVGAMMVYLAGILTYIFGFGGDMSVLSRPVVGASGAVFGLLLAYGYIYSERVIYFMMIFPMKARNFTLLIAGIELVNVLNHGFGSPIANLAHLGGIVSGLAFLKIWKIWQRLLVLRWKKLKGRVHLKILKDRDKNSESKKFIH